MREDIICAGFGGQGIIFLGKLLAHIGMCEGKFVTWMPSYGAEVRGGTAYSMVKIYDEEIASPVFLKPTSAIILNQPSFDKFSITMVSGGIVVLNSSLAKRNPKAKAIIKSINLINVPMTDIAKKLGDVRAANIVGMGAYIARVKALKIETAKKVLEEILKNKKDLLKINLAALNKGYQHK